MKHLLRRSKAYCVARDIKGVLSRHLDRAEAKRQRVVSLTPSGPCHGTALLSHVNEPFLEDAQEKVAIGEDIEAALEYYPLLDEMRFSEMEWEEARRAWRFLSLGERVDLCGDRDLNIFSARHEEPPSELIDLLAR